MRWNENEKSLQDSLEILGEFGLNIVGHTDYIMRMRISSDNENVVSGSFDGSVCIWELATRRLKYKFKEHTMRVYDVALGIDNTTLISCSEDLGIILYNLNTLQKVQQFRHTQSVFAVELTMDLTSVIFGDKSGTISILSLQHNIITSQLNEWRRPIWMIIRCPQYNDTFAIGSFGEVLGIVNSNSVLIEKKLPHPGPVTAVCFTPNSKYLISGCMDSIIRVFLYPENVLTAMLKGHQKSIRCVNSTPDSKYLVSSSTDNSIMVWLLYDFSLHATLLGHQHYVHSVLTTIDSKFIVSSSWDKSIRIWSIEEKRVIDIFQTHSADVTCLEATKDGKYFISGAKDTLVKVWDFSTRRHVGTLEGHNGGVITLKLTPRDKYIVTSSEDFTYRVWRGNTSW